MFHVKQVTMEKNNAQYTKEQIEEFKRLRFEMVDSMVSGICVYANGNAILSRVSADSGVGKGGGRRGKVTELSSISRSRMLFVMSSTDVKFGSMITLTYPVEYPSDGKRAKSHLNDFLRSLQNRYGGSYFWFIEFQVRGAPHFHVFHTRGKIFSADRKWMAIRWAECMGIYKQRMYTSLMDGKTKDMWVQCMRVNTHIDSWQEIHSEDGARRYCAKYALKTRQKEVPDNYKDVGRFYGYSRDVKARCKPIDSFSTDAETIRSILELEGHRVSEWDVLPKYLFGVSSFLGLTKVL